MPYSLNFIAEFNETRNLNLNEIELTEMMQKMKICLKTSLLGTKQSWSALHLSLFVLCDIHSPSLFPPAPTSISEFYSTLYAIGIPQMITELGASTVKANLGIAMF